MRGYTIKHLIVLTLSLLFVGADALATASAPPAPRVTNRVRRVAVVAGTLAAGAVKQHDLRFARGREHYVVAACEGTCGDVSLHLFSPAGRELDRSQRAGARPQVSTIPSDSARYRLDVAMMGCVVNRCGYSLNVFSR